MLASGERRLRIHEQFCDRDVYGSLQHLHKLLRCRWLPVVGHVLPIFYDDGLQPHHHCCAYFAHNLSHCDPHNYAHHYGHYLAKYFRAFYCLPHGDYSSGAAAKAGATPSSVLRWRSRAGQGRLRECVLGSAAFGTSYDRVPMAVT